VACSNELFGKRVDGVIDMANEDKIELTMQDWMEVNTKVQSAVDSINEIKTNHLPHLEVAVETVDARVEKLADKFDGRPSWAVMWIITSLTAMATTSTTLLVRTLVLGP